MNAQQSTVLREVGARLRRLQELEAELHDANEEFKRAARLLKELPELNDGQRGEIGSQLRAAQARWAAVTRRISEALSNGQQH